MRFFSIYIMDNHDFFNYSMILVLNNRKSQHISTLSIVKNCNTSCIQATIDTLMTFVIVAIILPVKYFTDFFPEPVPVNAHV